MEENVHSGHRKRMKEKLLSGTLDDFNDHQVLELLLFYSVPRADTNPLAHRLLDAFGSLSGVLDATYQDLMQVEGVTASVATEMIFFQQLFRRYYIDRYEKPKRYTKIEDVDEYLRRQLFGVREERIMIMCMDNTGKPLYTGLIAKGTVAAAEVNLRLIVEKAIGYHATGIVIAHNHPSGFAFPSKADMETTKTLSSMLNALDVLLLDHVVIAEDDYISFRQTASCRAALGRQE